MNGPKVSIVMPVYNAEKYLKEALDSVVHQSYKNLEIICVDDGSTDFSLDILKNYKSNDPRIHILTQKNQYAGVARNSGLDYATGEYIMFLDSDDVFEKNMVAYLVGKAKRYDPDIIVFGYNLFRDQVKRRRPVRNQYGNGILCSAKDISETIFQMTRSMPWDKFLKTEFVKKAGIRYDQMKVNNDVYFNRVIVAEASKMLFCTKRLINYRISNLTSLQGGLDKNPVDFLVAIEKVYDELRKRGLYNLFRNSYKLMVISNIILHLQRIESYNSFSTIVAEIKDRNVFEKLHIVETADIILNHPYRQTLISLLSGNVNESLAKLYYETQRVKVEKASIEYQIGYRLLKAFHLTY